MDKRYEDLEDWQQRIIDTHKMNLNNELNRHSNKGKGILISFIIIVFLAIATILTK